MKYSKKKDSSPVAGHRVTKSAGILFVASLLALLMVIAGALPALAADGKIYPGAMGVPTPCDGNNRPTYSYGYGWGAIGNHSATSWLYLDLPAIRDAHGINKSWVRVIDRHDSADIRCQLHSTFWYGHIYCGWFSPYMYSSGSGSHEQVLSLGGVGANTISHYYFSCRIPPKYNNGQSCINSYYVEED
ncbi:MAG: hypothetical protein C4B58_00040 [Deltaproteobacteria bacterium]|nr:MAG: hypothetical protein C4B58_00040 [Deltaproteobacteria bacterium]